jgi:segregation and condensation protein B
MTEAAVGLRGAVEALLFVSDEPVSAARLARVLDAAPGEVESVLAELAEEYRVAERGFQLREVAGGWRLYTHPAHHDVIEQYVLSWDTRRLSQAALEALAVIAYHQPVTRNGVNAVRGVNSEGVIASLVEKGLVREVGRDRNQGNAILYGTTRAFLEKFGLKDITELPPLEEFAPDTETAHAIRDRLSAGESSFEPPVAADDEGDLEMID